MTDEPEQQQIVVSPVIDRDGRHRVLLQLADGWVTMTSRDARNVAQILIETADQSDRHESTGVW